MSPKPPAKKPFPIFWVAVGVVVAIGIVVVIVSAGGTDSKKKTKGGSDTPNSKEFGPVTVTGTALAQFPDSGSDQAVGQAIPTVSGENFAGEPGAIAANGKAQLIVFLAHWCPHCNAEAPKLASYLQDNGGLPAGVDLTIVPTGSRSDAPNWPPSQWVKDMNLGYVTTLVDSEDQKAAAAFGLTSYPFMVMVDKDGTVVARRAGEQADGFFGRVFSALAAGEPIPTS
ncbi:MAG: TlpA family protein disulfide reductase [Acidimicrobiia bacterium]|nr:TlpA family protein disulfide reductase [Acidimicrobiia bacterium]